MVCKNYHMMGEQEIDEYIQRMRSWLHSNNGHTNYQKVVFALDVALNAMEYVDSYKSDDFLYDVARFML